MYDVPLRVRSGARGGYLGWHGADIVAMIRNSVGSTSTFTKGGAYSVDSIYYAKLADNIDSVQSAYQWCINQGAVIINASWGLTRWTSTYYDSMANKIDYYLDMYSSEDYILNVVSAGNNGPDGSDYIQCVGAGNPGWDTSTCQRVNNTDIIS